MSVSLSGGGNDGRSSGLPFCSILTGTPVPRGVTVAPTTSDFPTRDSSVTEPETTSLSPGVCTPCQGSLESNPTFRPCSPRSFLFDHGVRHPSPRSTPSRLLPSLTPTGRQVVPTVPLESSLQVRDRSTCPLVLVD